MVKGDSPLNEGEVGASTNIFKEGFTMMKKKTWSMLLSLIVTLSVLISYTGTVMADPVDPAQGDTTAQTEQAGPEDPADPEKPADPAKAEDPADTNDPAAPAQGEDPAAPAQGENNEDPADTKGNGDSSDPVNQKSRAVNNAPAKGANDAEGGSSTNDGESGSSSTTDPNDPHTQEANVNSGYIGDLHWDLTTNNLTISGDGAMPDFSAPSYAPWYAFRNDIISITIESGVTSIGNYAFLDCTSILDISFTASRLTRVGTGAFKNCTSLQFVSLPGTVTAIEDYAFYKCVGLSYFSWPESLVTIGNSAFAYTALNSFNLPTNLTTIGEEAFAHCNNIYYVQFANKVTSVGDGAFSECAGLHDIYMNDSVKTIGKEVFKNSTIYSFTYPKNVKVIAEGSFSGCTSLDSVNFGESITTIEANAFNGCSNLSNLIITDNVKSIAAGAFTGCSKLTEISAFADPAKLTWGASASDFIENKGTKCIVPSRYFDAYVAKFGSLNLDFESNAYGSGVCGENLTWMIDGDGTMVISGTGPMYDYVAGDQPWYSISTRIKKVVVESGVTSIGDYAFGSDCGALIKVTLSDTVKSIGSYAFADTNNLEGIKLPEGLTTIKSHAFENSAIKSANIPSTVTTITEAAFKNCNLLEAIELHDNITTIEDAAFAGTGIRSVTIPGSVTNWGTSTFSRSSLTSVTVSEGITRIPDSSFYRCTDLTVVNLANSITAIGKEAFFTNYEYSEGSIESITLPSNLTTLENYAFAGQSLRSITIPGGVSEIVTDAFSGCDSLNTIVIQKGVTTIQEGAFNYCDSIKSVSIPSTVTYIDYRAFSEGSYMKDIYLYPNPANLYFFFEISDYGNINLNESTKIHVLENYLEAYQAKYANYANLFVGDLDPNEEAVVDIGSGVHLYGYNLSLAGDIGVNFWFKLSEENLEDGDNYIEFTVNGQKQIVKLSDATDDPSGSGAKVFRCSVVAKQMSDVISAQFYNSEGFTVGMKYSYSIKEYANFILTHNNYTAHDKNVAKAMVNYGAATQKYFNYNAGALANDILSDSDRVINIKDYQNIVVTTSHANKYIEPAMVSLILKSTITLKLYFHAADLENITVKYNDDVVNVTPSGDFMVVKIEGIPATQIHSLLYLTFYDANDEFLGMTNYCPNQYIRLILSQPENDPLYTDDLKRLVSALYDFNRALQV